MFLEHEVRDGGSQATGKVVWTICISKDALPFMLSIFETSILSQQPSFRLCVCVCVCAIPCSVFVTHILLRFALRFFT